MSEADVKDKTVVVIDVLRACSTICTALSHGARTVIPVSDMAEAGKMAANLDQSISLLGGERGGEKIQGYHLGNSPLEYTREVVADRVIVLNTTNGTGAIRRAKAANRLVIGCFLNAGRVVEYVKSTNQDVVILCSGWLNRVALEDALCAGLMLDRLWEGKEPEQVSDTAHIAYTVYQHERDSVAAAVKRANHAQRLYNLGYGADVEYCSQIDVLPILPLFKENRLVLDPPWSNNLPKSASRTVRL